MIVSGPLYFIWPSCLSPLNLDGYFLIMNDQFVIRVYMSFVLRQAGHMKTNDINSPPQPCQPVLVCLIRAVNDHILPPPPPPPTTPAVLNDSNITIFIFYHGDIGKIEVLRKAARWLLLRWCLATYHDDQNKTDQKSDPHLTFYWCKDLLWYRWYRCDKLGWPQMVFHEDGKGEYIFLYHYCCDAGGSFNVERYEVLSQGSASIHLVSNIDWSNKDTYTTAHHMDFFQHFTICSQ